MGFVGRHLLEVLILFTGFPSGLVVKNSPANAGDAGDACMIPGSGRSPEGGNDNPLQYSCLENPMDIGTWRVTVHGVTRSLIQLSTITHSVYDSLFRSILNEVP